MALKPEHEDELRAVQDQAIAHAIEEMNLAATLPLTTKEERGDRFWLTKMCKESLTVAAKVESFIMLRNRPDSTEPPDDETVERAVDRMIKQARGEVTAVLERARKGYRPRGRGDE